jgi:REP element-mobilizing transposase RayT
MARSRSDQLSFTDYRMHHGQGGPRKGAGRKASGRRCELRRARPKFDRLTPVHVTLRVRGGLPSLQGPDFIREIRKSFAFASERGDFRLVHYSVQSDHVHLIVEASDQDALGRGMKAINARIARAVHRIFNVCGRVLSGSYHAQLLKTPRQVYRAIAYVLMNTRKHFKQRHGREPRKVQLDEASSARWFTGFARLLPADRTGSCEVSHPRSWLLGKGWRKHGLIDPAFVPGAA